eukprot:gene12470-14629_t
MEYDLTKQICGFLDAHLMLPLVEFAKGYTEEQVNTTKADILAQTGLFEQAIAANQTVGRDVASLQEKKTTMTAQLEQLKKECEVVSQFIAMKKDPATKQEKKEKKEEDAEELVEETVAAAAPAAATPAATAARNESSLAALREKVTPEIVASLYRLAKLSFELGNYVESRDYLDIFCKLSNDKQKNISALWGILESDILSLNWAQASTSVIPLKDEIDSNNVNIHIH